MCGNKKRGSRSVAPGDPPETGRQTKKGVPGASRSTGTPNVECGGVLLSHTLSSAVPSPRPGLSFRVRKGTGRLTWAMTTAKPIQRPTGRTGGRQRNQPRFRSWRSGNRTTDASNQTLHRYRFRDHKKQHSLPSNERNHHRTRPDPTSGSEKVCRVRPLVPVGSTPRGASTSGLSNTCSTCGLQAPKCQGILILEQASRLDAFSGYPSRT